MFGRSVATSIGFVGGVLVLLGAAVAFLGTVVGRLGSSGLGTLAGPGTALVLALVLGALILFTSRPRLFWWPGRRLFNGILLIVLGVFAWVLVGGFIVTALGALLTIVAGILLPFESLVFRSFGMRRRLFPRRFL